MTEQIICRRKRQQIIWLKRLIGNGRRTRGIRLRLSLKARSVLFGSTIFPTNIFIRLSWMEKKLLPLTIGQQVGIGSPKKKLSASLRPTSHWRGLANDQRKSLRGIPSNSLCITTALDAMPVTTLTLSTFDRERGASRFAKSAIASTRLDDRPQSNNSFNPTLR